MARFTPEQKPAEGSISMMGIVEFILQKYEKQGECFKEL
jgi:hypothetical protein